MAKFEMVEMVEFEMVDVVFVLIVIEMVGMVGMVDICVRVDDCVLTVVDMVERFILCSC